jgi:hypothetical protein
MEYHGSSSYFYKVRLYNKVSATYGEFSLPFTLKQKTTLPSADICVGYLKLADWRGRAATQKEVLVHNDYTSQLKGEYTIVGGPERYLTDSDGYVEVPLVRGLVISVGLVGTNLLRKVTVPTDPSVTKFNLLDPKYGVDDAFTVQQADLPYAERTRP